jgi:hypothetical protein
MVPFSVMRSWATWCIGGGRRHDEEEAWFGPAESKTEEDDADREPMAFYILCFSPRSDLSALFVGAGRGGKVRGFMSEPAPAVLARVDRAGSCDVSTVSDLCSRLPCWRGSTPWLARSSPAACACPPAAREEVKKRQANDSFLHGNVDKAIDHYTEAVPPSRRRELLAGFFLPTGRLKPSASGSGLPVWFAGNRSVTGRI